MTWLNKVWIPRRCEYLEYPLWFCTLAILVTKVPLLVQDHQCVTPSGRILAKTRDFHQEPTIPSCTYVKLYTAWKNRWKKAENVFPPLDVSQVSVRAKIMWIHWSTFCFLGGPRTTSKWPQTVKNRSKSAKNMFPELDISQVSVRTKIMWRHWYQCGFL